MPHTTRYGFMPVREVHPFLDELRQLCKVARMSMSKVCAEVLGEPDFPVKLKQQKPPSDEKMNALRRYFTDLKSERLERRQKGSSEATSYEKNEKQLYESARLGSLSLLRALLNYGLNHNGLPGMDALALVQECHNHNIKTAGHHFDLAKDARS